MVERNSLKIRVLFKQITQYSLPVHLLRAIREDTCHVDNFKKSFVAGIKYIVHGITVVCVVGAHCHTVHACKMSQSIDKHSLAWAATSMEK